MRSAYRARIARSNRGAMANPREALRGMARGGNDNGISRYRRKTLCAP